MATTTRTLGDADVFPIGLGAMPLSLAGPDEDRATRKGRSWELDGRPDHIRAACEASLAALETDVIDLYQYHRPDPDVPYAETIGAFQGAPGRGQGAASRHSRSCSRGCSRWGRR